MSEWITVDVNDVNKEVAKNFNGVEVRMRFSPYDVPRRFRGYREPNTHYYVVEFEYLTPEETRPEVPCPNSPIELEIGKNSQRIYKVKLDMEKVKKLSLSTEGEPATGIARKIVGVIQHFQESVPERLQERYKMPEKLVFNNRDRLFSEIPELAGQKPTWYGPDI
jgi:hypothetical protein